MKQTWDNLTTDTENFKTEFEALLNILPDSAAIYKQQKRAEKEWRKLKTGFNKMDEFVSPMIKSVKVNSPLLKDADFIAAWEFWKKYLIEQHSIHMRSRAELMALKRLNDISKEKPALAIKCLEVAMGGIYKNFFVPDEKEVSASEAPRNNKGGMIVPVPAQYSGNGKPGKVSPHGGTSEAEGVQITLEEGIKNEKTEAN